MATGILPAFRYVGVVLEPEWLRYRPHPDIIHPSVIDAAAYGAQPLAQYYMYYAPHDVPGGICLAFADRPEGPWREYERNPIIARDWAPHYSVSHVSSPHVIWVQEEQQFFLYFHGENDTTRFAASRDGVRFEYGGVAVNTDMLGPGLTEASYARVFRHTQAVGKGPYVMMLMGNQDGTRKVYAAWSADARHWTAQRLALIAPPPGTGQMGPGWLLPWRDRFYIVDFANPDDSALYDPVSNLYLHEVSADFSRVTYRGLLMDHTVAGAANFRVNDPCLLRTPDRLYMFLNVGRRLHQSIALAIAECPDATPA